MWVMTAPPRQRPRAWLWLPSSLDFQAERAAEWLTEFEAARFRLRTWGYAREADMVSGYLNHDYNLGMGGSLTFQLKLDSTTGIIRSNIIASSLADLLQVQWGMSVAANVVHRQCQECTTWFSVHPGSGRPEKIFCSDACRMRAYRSRMRKAVR